MTLHTGIDAIALNDTLETLLAEHTTTSRTLYVAMLVTTVGGIGGAAATSVDLTIRAPATLTPAVERQTPRSPSDGSVDRVLVSVGSVVHLGDTLVALKANVAERAQAASLVALDAHARRRADLTAMLHIHFDDASLEQREPALHQREGQAAVHAAAVEWKQNSIPVRRAEHARDRVVQLGVRGFSSPAELEAADFELARAREERSVTLERHRSSWAVELATTEQTIASLERDTAARSSDRTARYITSPVTGTVEEMTALAAGSVVRAGDPIATISPDGPVFADALVAPRDVAHLRVGMKARLLIDGYDVQDWGASDAVVTSVAGDYAIVDGHPVFRVRVRPLRPVLRRANGTAATLRKGLRCQVRFLIGQQRLASFMRHRASEWLDPSTEGGR